MLIILLSLVALEGSAAFQYYYARKTLREEANRRATDQLEAIELRINNLVDQVETAVRNNMWSAREVAPMPDSLWNLTRGIVKDNPIIYGSTVALMENYSPSAGRFFAPYAYRRGNEILHTQLGTPEYDYPHQEWFVKAVETNGGYWSEPYFDEGGGNEMMTTYSVPVYDKSGKLAAVLTADVSLEWVTQLLKGVQVYPNSHNLMVSRSGRIMVSPAETLTLRHTIQDYVANVDSATVAQVHHAMSTQDSGEIPFRHKGKMNHLYFNKVDKTGWSMSIMIPDKEIYGSVSRMARIVSLLRLLSLLLVGVIFYLSYRSTRRMIEMSERKSLMESELEVARGIQMSMLPDVSPSAAGHSEVDLYAALVPAKEVGGDLYDFYIREGKLFFCIGDVSGKGVPASLVMARVMSYFRTSSAHETSPGRILTAINDNASATNDAGMFATMFCGVLDLASGHLQFCNAGHNAPVTLRETGIEYLDVLANLPIGVMPGISYVEQEMDLKPGDGLFLYTDGITEAEDINHLLFGEERLLEAMDRSLSTSDQVKAISTAVHGFCGAAPQSDDITVLYVRFTGSTPTQEEERTLVLHNDISEIPQLTGFVKEVGETASLDAASVMNLNLALEEAVTNVMMYAYPTGKEGLVELKARIGKDRLQFILSDSGVPFDPTAAPDPDTSLGVEDRPIGGLGIFLVRKIMDSVSYSRTGEKNVQTFTYKV